MNQYAEKRRNFVQPQKKPAKWGVYLLVVALLAEVFYVGHQIGEAGGMKPLIKQWIQQTNEERLKDYDVVKVVVKEGETAWQIQKQLTPQERDLRDALHLSQTLNSKSLGTIKAGDVVYFVAEKEKR
ncbi:hypothetical protein [Geobacillus subterraneus]|uniref:LysM domain-containing protein n=1 Tax=Geobacillus subterraneus TaxID=129338 RepID=A0A679FVF9_9BACL|nr:hypothetical protein [Geobacillus subterraneus]BBW98959.1 hypothetical protein GsuE55_37920 [Geobacillus subterraneus]